MYVYTPQNSKQTDRHGERRHVILGQGFEMTIQLRRCSAKIIFLQVQSDQNDDYICRIIFFRNSAQALCPMISHVNIFHPRRQMLFRGCVIQNTINYPETDRFIHGCKTFMMDRPMGVPVSPSPNYHLLPRVNRPLMRRTDLACRPMGGQAWLAPANHGPFRPPGMFCQPGSRRSQCI